MIVLVCGMHRSGTSAMAGMLHANGIHMGDEKDFYPPPMKENPKGFYENVRFRRINDVILKQSGYKVKSFSPDIPDISITQVEKTRDKMMDLINYYNKDHEHWGWKDPRTNLTLLSWMSMFHQMKLISTEDYKTSYKNIKCVYMFRAPEEVATSMRTRGNKETKPGQFEKLAEVYTQRFTKVANQYKLPVLGINFQDLINNTAANASALSLYLGKDITDISFIDPEIAKNVA